MYASTYQREKTAFPPFALAWQSACAAIENNEFSIKHTQTVVDTHETAPNIAYANACTMLCTSNKKKKANAKGLEPTQ